MPKLKSIKVALKLPFVGELEGTWEPNDQERLAAWEMYVELVTRIATAELKEGEGLLREALSSLYSLFCETRVILRSYGPGIAQPKGEYALSFGYIAVAVLNLVLRPMLARWHPALQDHESRRDKAVSPLEHERRWEREGELRSELGEVRLILTAYANLLAEAAGTPSLLIERDD
jgi:hypothetical protein